jgi:hypothetical protein
VKNILVIELDKMVSINGLWRGVHVQHIPSSTSPMILPAAMADLPAAMADQNTGRSTTSKAPARPHLAASSGWPHLQDRS